MSGSVDRIDVVRGSLTPELAQEVLDFWAANAAFGGGAAQRRLPEVVSVVRDQDGAIAGVGWAAVVEVPRFGGHRFWVHRRYLVTPGHDLENLVLVRAFETLQDEFVPGQGHPLGLAFFVRDHEYLRRHPDVIWADSGFVYAGYTADGCQVRVRYFEGAAIR